MKLIVDVQCWCQPCVLSSCECLTSRSIVRSNSNDLEATMTSEWGREPDSLTAFRLDAAVQVRELLRRCEVLRSEENAIHKRKAQLKSSLRKRGLLD